MDVSIVRSLSGISIGFPAYLCPLCSKPSTASDKLCYACSGKILFITNQHQSEVYAPAAWWGFDRINSDTRKETIGYSMFIHIAKKNNINVS